MSYWILLLTPFLLIVNEIYSEPAKAHVHRVETLAVSVEDLSSRYDAFILDAYGVFWGSREVGVLPGAADAMAYLVSQGKWVGILSNSTQLTAKEKEKLQKHGLFEGVHYHFLLTSGELAREILLEGDLPFATPRNTFWVFGVPHPVFGSHLHIFEGTKYRETEDIAEADFIHISIPHIDGVNQENPEVFRESVQSVAMRLPVLCVNPDRYGPEGSPPRPVVRQGWIAQMFKEQEAPVYFVGKPSKIIYEAALKRFPGSIARDRIVMIGDTPETDIRGAHGAGLDAALVTKTGVTAEFIEKEGMEAVLNRLPLDDKPDFLIERLNLGTEK